MKCFDAGTQKMSVSSFSSSTKLIKVQCTRTWVSPLRRRCKAEQQKVIMASVFPDLRLPDAFGWIVVARMYVNHVIRLSRNNASGTFG